MRYREIIEGRFIDRPNRFIAHVLINGVEETVHVKNTGRCRELLLPDAEVRLEVSGNPNRKTKYDLVAVYKEKLGWVNRQSGAEQGSAGVAGDAGLYAGEAGVCIRRFKNRLLYGERSAGISHGSKRLYSGD